MGVGDSIKNAFRFEEDKVPSDGGETGREGVPGAVTSGDPSMGGKHNDAEPGSDGASGRRAQRLGESSDLPGVVQTGDPSMGVRPKSFFFFSAVPCLTTRREWARDWKRERERERLILYRANIRGQRDEACEGDKGGEATVIDL